MSPFNPASNYTIAYETTSPANVATASATWTHGPFELGGDVRYVSDAEKRTGNPGSATVVTPIDAYTLVNGHAAYDITDWLTVALTGRNLFDDETETTQYAPLPRSFYLTLSSTF